MTIDLNKAAETFLANVHDGAAKGSLVKDFDNADRAASGDTGYEVNLKAAKAFGFPSEVLSAFDPNKDDNPWNLILSKAQDEARPFAGPTFRQSLADLALRAVNASGEDEAVMAKKITGKVPARKLPADTTREQVEADLRAECARVLGDTANTPEKVKEIYQLALNGICNEGDTDGLVALGKRINSETVASARWIAKAVYLPIVEPYLDEYTKATKGHGVKTVGSVWQEAARKAASAHKGAFKDGDGNKIEPTLEDISTAIEETCREYLGLDNIREVIVGRAKPGTEEQMAAALKAVYAGLRKLDELTSDEHGLLVSITPILRHVGADTVGDEKAAKKAEAEAKKRASDKAATEARAKALADKKAASAKPTPVAAATGADVTRAQSEIDAADKAAVKVAKKGPAKKPDVAALDVLSAQVSGKPASGKPASGKPIAGKKAS